jgi:hypothetical protein
MRWTDVMTYGLSVLALTMTLHVDRVPQIGTGSVPSVDGGNGLILGRTVDGDSGAPLAHVFVTLTAMSLNGRPTMNTADATPNRPGLRPALTVVSDENGWFVFHDLPAGAFTFACTLWGYLGGGYNQHAPDGAGQPVSLSDGQRLGDLTLKLWKMASITGTVTDEAGEPVIAASIRVLKRTTVAGQPVLQAVEAGQPGTDDRGIYRAYNLVPGNYLVCVPQTATTVAVASNASSPSPSRPAPSSPEFGLVHRPTQGVPPPAAPDARRFVYPTLCAPSASGTSGATLVSLKSGQDQTNIDVHLVPVPTFRVSGVISGSNGPAPGLQVQLVVADADPRAMSAPSADSVAATGAADAQGRFTFVGIPRGDYVIQAAARAGPFGQFGPPGAAPVPNLQWAKLPVSIDADVDSLAVALQLGLQVSGQLVFEGQSPRPTADQLQQGPAVRLTPLAAGAGGRSVGPLPGMGNAITADGRFVVADLMPGAYALNPPGWVSLKWIVTSITAGGADVSDLPLQLGAGDLRDVVITYTDEPAKLTGAVRDRSGHPDSRAHVVVFPPNSTAWGWSGGLHSASAGVNAAGTYALGALPSGDYAVAAIPDDWGTDWRDPVFLGRVLPLATRVQLRAGDSRTENLTVVDIR